MSRYAGQHFSAEPMATAMPAFTTVPRRRSKGMIAASAASLVLALTGGFFAGRFTAPDETTTATTPSTNGDGSSTPAASLGDELVTQGLALHQAGKLDEAAALYQQALTKDPANKFALFNLGQIAHTQKKYPAAIEKYLAVLKVDAKYGPALYNIGLAYASNGDRANAITYLRKAADVSPTSAPVLFNLGTVLVQDGKADEGTQLIAKAIALDPTIKPAS